MVKSPRPLSLLVWLCLAGLCLVARAWTAEEVAWVKTGEFTWTDPETKCEITQVTREGTNNKIAYFHDPCFLDGGLFYRDVSGPKPVICRLDPVTLKSEVFLPPEATTYTVSEIRHEVIYFQSPEIRAKNPTTGVDRKLFDLPPEVESASSGFRVSSDGRTLYLHRQDMTNFTSRHDMRNTPQAERESEIDRILDAKLPNKLWAVDLETGHARLLIDGHAWLGHFQPSPTDPDLLLFCHEGLWNRTQRMWLIRRDGTGERPVYPHNLDQGKPPIFAGHEFWDPSGKKIWFDLRETYAPEIVYLATETLDGVVERYALDPRFWSVHYNISVDGRLLAGDGGAYHFKIAKGTEGQDRESLFLFVRRGEGKLEARKVCDLSQNNYTACEPNVRFSPDGRDLYFCATDSPTSDHKQIYRVSLSRLF